MLTLPVNEKLAVQGSQWRAPQMTCATNEYKWRAPHSGKSLSKQACHDIVAGRHRIFAISFFPWVPYPGKTTQASSIFAGWLRDHNQIWMQRPMERTLHWTRYKSYQNQVWNIMGWSWKYMNIFEMSLLWKNLYFFPVAQPLDLGLAVGDHRCCRMLSRSPRCNLQVMCAMRCNEQHRIIERIGHTSFGRVSSSEMLQRKRLQQTPRKKNNTSSITPNHFWHCLLLPAKLAMVSPVSPFAPWTVGLVARSSSSSKAGWTFCSFPFSSWKKQNDKNWKNERQVGKHGLFLLQNSYYIICKYTKILFQMRRTNTSTLQGVVFEP